jgi:dihydroorotase
MPQPSFDCVLINGAVVNQDGIGVRDIGVRDGRIAEIGDLSRAGASERIDCRGLHILPGVIDSQVHFREPGLVHKEDLETGSRAAVLGGVTAVFEMPNTDPLTTSANALADKLARAKGRMHCDFAFWVGGTHDNVADIPELERLPGAAGIKVFMGSSTGRLLVADDEGVLAILKQTSRRLPQRGRGPPQRAQDPARRRRSLLASRLARRNRSSAFDRATHSARAPVRRAGACAAYLDP